jgi:hypothetical protein
MSETLQRATPIMGARASFHSDHTRWQISKKYCNLPAPQLFAQHCVTPFINRMHLEQILRQINSDRCNLHRGRSHSFKWSLSFPLWHIDAV